MLTPTTNNNSNNTSTKHMVDAAVVQRYADRLGRGWTRVVVAVPLLRIGTEQDPLPAAAMLELESSLTVLRTAQEPSALMKK